MSTKLWPSHNLTPHHPIRDFAEKLAEAASAVAASASPTALLGGTNNVSSSGEVGNSSNSSGTGAVTDHDPQQNVKPLTDAELHRVMLAPWVLGVFLQAIFFGIVISQLHTIFANRKWVSKRAYATTLFLFITNSASFCCQSSVLWFFSMSSLGEVRLVMLQFPGALLVDLWLTPLSVGICNLGQMYFAYQDSGQKKRVLLPLIPLWLVQVTSSLLNMVLTTRVFRAEKVNSELWGYASYVHLLSRVSFIVTAASLRLFLGLRKIRLPLRSCSSILKIVDLVFASDILGVVPAGIEAGTVLREWRLSTAANVAYTCTPRVCTSAFLASLILRFEQIQEAAQRRVENERAKVNFNIAVAIPSARPRYQEDSIELA